MRIDLNADLGESRERWDSGEDIALLQTVTSANVCCGAYAGDEELPSEPCLRGSIQITAEGQPIAFGPDHPVTGGYPVIAVIHDADTDLLGQARPGQPIRFFLRLH